MAFFESVVWFALKVALLKFYLYLICSEKGVNLKTTDKLVLPEPEDRAGRLGNHASGHTLLHSAML